MEVLERNTAVSESHPHTGVVTTGSNPTALACSELATPIKTDLTTPLRKIKSCKLY